jgi:hypothetical protein
MNLILAIFLLLEAVSEGLRTGGHYLASEIVEVIYLAGITYMAFAWLNWRLTSITYTRLDSLLKVLIGYLLLRFALFDVIWNISAGQDIFYYGTTKLYDRIMVELGSWGWMMKAIAGFWGIAWLLGWENGIRKVVKRVLKTRKK